MSKGTMGARVVVVEVEAITRVTMVLVSLTKKALIFLMGTTRALTGPSPPTAQRPQTPLTLAKPEVWARAQGLAISVLGGRLYGELPFRDLRRLPLHLSLRRLSRIPQTLRYSTNIHISTCYFFILFLKCQRPRNTSSLAYFPSFFICLL